MNSDGSRIHDLSLSSSGGFSKVLRGFSKVLRSFKKGVLWTDVVENIRRVQ